MATIDILIGGHSYNVSCRDGEEDHLRALAAIVAQKADEARGAVGGTSETRQLLLAALLLADEVNDARSGTSLAPSRVDIDAEIALEHLAVTIEELASRLENRAHHR